MNTIKLFYQHVTLLDIAYWDLTHKAALGDSYIVDIELTGHTDDESVVVDFSKGKNHIKKMIDDLADHRLVLSSDVASAGGMDLSCDVMTFKRDHLYYKAPSQAYCILPQSYQGQDEFQQQLANYLEEKILPTLSRNIKNIKIILRREELPLPEITFHYTHGLKQHYGNCQRLIHGHRNTIKVLHKGKYSKELSIQLVSELVRPNVHFCFWENVQNQHELATFIKHRTADGPLGKFEIPENNKGNTYIEIRYQGNQGEFLAHMPVEQVFILPIESTVENIAYCLRHYLSLQTHIPFSDLAVQAFEGIGKGAISS